MRPAAKHFQGYSYRTSARFGSRVEVSVNNGIVTIAGPRIGKPVYNSWIYGQVAILWLFIPLLLLFSGLRRNIKYLFGALFMGIAHLGISGLGAAVLWEGANAGYIEKGGRQDSVTFPVASVRNVTVGPGWARGIVRLAILPYVPGINRLATGHAVSFDAPDDLTGRTVTYAIHMYSREGAQTLAMLLRGEYVGGAVRDCSSLRSI